MGPVNIAVDSYGPVTDNAQSIFELAQTEKIPGIKDEIKRDFGFEPDFERGKHYLEANDSAGNTLGDGRADEHGLGSRLEGVAGRVVRFEVMFAALEVRLEAEVALDLVLDTADLFGLGQFKD